MKSTIACVQVSNTRKHTTHTYTHTQEKTSTAHNAARPRPATREFLRWHSAPWPKLARAYFRFSRNTYDCDASERRRPAKPAAHWMGSMKASCGIRAHDLPLTERVLYQLS